MEVRTVKVLQVLGAIVLVLAAGFLIMSRSNSGGGPESLRGQMTWLKCLNNACGHTWQIDMADYGKYLVENAKPMEATLLVCEKCKEKSAIQAVKCDKCGKIFVSGQKSGDFADRCECGYSRTEDERKRQLEQGAGNE